MKRALLWLWLGAALLLGGCSAFAPQEAVEGSGETQRWRSHKTQVARIDAWQISGKVGIRAVQDSGSGTLFWLQRQDYHDIRLSGPLGRGAARLTGREGEVLLEVANQGRYQAASAEDLLQQQLGWRLPVSHLLWWVRGLPSPDSRSRLTLDSDSRLAHLEQDGWHITYSQYARHDHYWLPGRLRLSGHDLDITLVIKEWLPRRLAP